MGATSINRESCTQVDLFIDFFYNLIDNISIAMIEYQHKIDTLNISLTILYNSIARSCVLADRGSL